MRNQWAWQGAVCALALVAVVSGVGSTARAASDGNGSRLLNLYQEIQQLQSQVRHLNGEVETLRHNLAQARERNQDLYQNLDTRLSKLEGNNSGGPSSGAASSSENKASNAQPASGASGAGGGNQAMHAAYMQGFNALQNGKYDAAIAKFQSFVKQYPDSGLTDNAWYWLGEAYYVQQQLESSKKAFQTVVNQFKNSSKVPGSLYKIGEIEAAQGHDDNAKATLQRVIRQYPKSDAADRAKSKLDSLDKS